MNLQTLKQNLNNDIAKVLTKLGVEFEDFGDNIYSTCPIHSTGMPIYRETGGHDLPQVKTWGENSPSENTTLSSDLPNSPL